MKIISIQVYFEGICISQTTANRAKIYFEDPTYFCMFWGVIDIKVFSKTNI